MTEATKHGVIKMRSYNTWLTMIGEEDYWVPFRI